jgi:hypothetical protein
MHAHLCNIYYSALIKKIPVKTIQHYFIIKIINANIVYSYLHSFYILYQFLIQISPVLELFKYFELESIKL